MPLLFIDDERYNIPDEKLPELQRDVQRYGWDVQQAVQYVVGDASGNVQTYTLPANKVRSFRSDFRALGNADAFFDPAELDEEGDEARPANLYTYKDQFNRKNTIEGLPDRWMMPASQYRAYEGHRAAQKQAKRDQLMEELDVKLKRAEELRAREKNPLARLTDFFGQQIGDRVTPLRTPEKVQPSPVAGPPVEDPAVLDQLTADMAPTTPPSTAPALEQRTVDPRAPFIQGGARTERGPFALRGPAEVLPPAANIPEPDTLSDRVKKQAKSSMASARIAQQISSGNPDAAKVAEDMKIMRDNIGSDAFVEFIEAEGPKEIAKALAKDPVGITAEVLASSLPAQIQVGSRIVPKRALLGTGVGAATGTPQGTLVGLRAGVAQGMGETSYTLQWANSLMGELAKIGQYDVTDPEELQKAFADEELMAQLRQQAKTLAIPVYALDTMSAAMAGRLFKSPAKTAVGKILQGQAEMAAQAGAGSGGELLSQVAAGTGIEPGPIAAEALGELGSGAVEVAVGTGIRAAERAVAPDAETTILTAEQIAFPEEAGRATPPPLPEQQAEPVSDTVPEQDVAAYQEEEVVDVEDLEEEPGEETPTTTIMAAGGLPIREAEVPLDQIQLSKDVPQFKEQASATTGEVTPLEGPFERLGTGRIILWERENGDLEVVTGRHRFQHAKRTGETTIPAQIVREADGFTQADAMTIDAESNIRDNQGSVKDYASYFRNTDIEQEAAQDRGLLRTDKGRAGFAVGRQASDDLYTLFQNGKISVAKARAIAEAAPNNTELQAVGITYARKHNADQTGQYLNAMQTFTPDASAAQIDLFGANDAWQVEAEKMAKAAASRVSELTAERKALRSARTLSGDKQQKILSQYGFETGDLSGIEGRISEVEEEIARWDQWHTDPEMVKQVRALAGLEESQETADVQATTAPDAAPSAIDAQATETDTAPAAETPGAVEGAPDDSYTMDLEEFTKGGDDIQQMPRIGTDFTSEPTGEGVPAEIDPKKLNTWRKAKRRITKQFGIPIRTGKFTKHARAIFKVREKVVRSQLYDDMEGTAHEFGHAISDFLDFETTMGDRYDSELMPLGVRTSGPNYTDAQIREEGFAEFYRAYLVNNQLAQELAPTFYDAFNRAIIENKKVSDGVSLMMSEYTDLLAHSPVQKVASSIVWDKDAPGMSKLESFYYDWLDDLNPLKNMMTKVFGKNMPTILSDVHTMALISRGADERFDGWMKNGIRTLDNKKLSEGLRPLLQKVSSKERFVDFNIYLKALRTAVDISAKQREADRRSAQLGEPKRLYATPEDIQASKEAVAALEEKHPDFPALREELTEFTDALLKVSVVEGLLTKDEANIIAEKNTVYIPFRRVFDQAVGSSAPSKAVPFKRFMGGRTEPTVMPLAALVQNVNNISKAVGQQQVFRALDLASRKKGAGFWLERLATPPTRPSKLNMKKIADLIREQGYEVEDIESDVMMNVFNVPGRYGIDEPIISYVSRGDRKYLRVKDQFVYDVLMNSNEKAAMAQANVLIKLASALRSSATLTLNFIVRNPTRDTIQAGIMSKNGFIPFVDSAVGALHVIFNTDTYQSFKNSGAGQASFVAPDVDLLQKELQKLGRGRLESIFRETLGNPLDGLRTMSDLMEKSTKLGEYAKAKKKALSQGKSEREAEAYAAQSARDITVDFMKAGRKGRQINRTHAFFNAMVQGREKTVREMKANPFSFLAKSAILVTLPKVLEYMLMKDDEEYKELPEWVKRTHYVMKAADGGFIRIPMPHGAGFMFGHSIVKVLEAMENEDPTALKELAESLGDVAQEDLLHFVVPTAGIPIVEVMANYDFFRERDIVNHYNKNLPPEDQYTHWTSDSMKDLSSLMARHLPTEIVPSPAKLDHLIYGYTAGLGRMVVSGSDAAVRALQGRERAPRPATNPAEKLPILNAFVAGNPRGGSQSIRNFYELKEEISGLDTAISRASGERKRTLQERRREALDGASPTKLKSADKKMSEGWKKIGKIYKDMNKTPRQKRLELDAQYEKILKAAQSVVR